MARKKTRGREPGGFFCVTFKNVIPAKAGTYNTHEQR